MTSCFPSTYLRNTCLSVGENGGKVTPIEDVVYFVVDGTNIARDRHGKGRGCLGDIDAVLAAIHTQFPNAAVTLMMDASGLYDWPKDSSDRKRVEQEDRRGGIQFAPAGREADFAILQRARVGGGWMVTRDSYREFKGAFPDLLPERRVTFDILTDTLATLEAPNGTEVTAQPYQEDPRRLASAPLLKPLADGPLEASTEGPTREAESLAATRSDFGRRSESASESGSTWDSPQPPLASRLSATKPESIQSAQAHRPAEALAGVGSPNDGGIAGWFRGIWTKYASFSGRSRRREFWLFWLFNMIASYAVIRIDELMGYSSQDGAGPLFTIYFFAVLLPFLAVSVRRMHDSNHGGWWLIVPYVPLAFLFIDGTHGPNRFGPDPKNPLGVSPSLVPAGWLPDPTGRHQFRYWDSAQWTPAVADNGVTSVDQL